MPVEKYFYFEKKDLYLRRPRYGDAKEELSRLPWNPWKLRKISSDEIRDWCRRLKTEALEPEILMIVAEIVYLQKIAQSVSSATVDDLEELNGLIDTWFDGQKGNFKESKVNVVSAAVNGIKALLWARLTESQRAEAEAGLLTLLNELLHIISTETAPQSPDEL